MARTKQTARRPYNMPPTTAAGAYKSSWVGDQRSALRCRIRDNATAIISGMLESLRKPYKPNKVQDENVNNSTSKDLWEEQNALMEKVEQFKNTKDVKAKNDIIRALRKKYPKIAREYPEPKDPVVKPVASMFASAPQPDPMPSQSPIEKPVEKSVEKSVEKPVEKPVQDPFEDLFDDTFGEPLEKPSEKPAQQQVEKSIEKSSAVPRLGTEPPPSYDRACGLTGTVQVNQAFGGHNLTPAQELQELFPNFRPQSDYTMSPNSTAGTKRSAPDPVIKTEPEIDLTLSPEPEDTRDGDYTEVAATGTRKRRKRSALTKADLEYQLTELNFKHKLQQISIKKAMAKLDGDQMAEAQLQLEEADVQHEQKKAAVARKMEELRKEG